MHKDYLPLPIHKASICWAVAVLNELNSSKQSDQFEIHRNNIFVESVVTAESQALS